MKGFMSVSFIFEKQETTSNDTEIVITQKKKTIPMDVEIFQYFTY